jgi:putative DNA primase/helicase
MSATAKPVVLNLADVQAQEVSWLWPDRVPFGKFTIFAGDPGLGKSFASLWLVADVTRQGFDAIILSAEDDPADTLRPRLDALGADVSRVHILKAVQMTDERGAQKERMLRLDLDIDQIAETIKQHPATELVVIDPLSAYMGGIDSRSDEQVRSILAPLGELASKTGVAIVCIKHLNKAEEKSAIYRAGGSIGFIAAARVAWLFVKDRSDPERRLMLLAKSNIGPDPGGKAYRIVDSERGVRIEWESGTVQIGLEDALRPASGYRESVLDEATVWLREMLGSGSKQATEVTKAAKDAGYTSATLRRAAKALGVAKAREGFGSEGQWIWSLP